MAVESGLPIAEVRADRSQGEHTSSERSTLLSLSCVLCSVLPNSDGGEDRRRTNQRKEN